jgi:hypothetical protein
VIDRLSRELLQLHTLGKKSPMGWVAHATVVRGWNLNAVEERRKKEKKKKNATKRLLRDHQPGMVFSRSMYACVLRLRGPAHERKKKSLGKTLPTK